MNIKKKLNKDKALKMIEALLENKKGELPDSKSLKDFGGGYVECIKTKANVVLYFGFDGSNNRVSIKCQINREDVMLWMEALSERVWNVETAEEAIDIDTLLSTSEPIMDTDTNNHSDKIILEEEDSSSTAVTTNTTQKSIFEQMKNGEL